MATLGDAYINIIPKAPGISANVENLLGGGAAGQAAQKAGASLGAQLMKGLAKLGITAWIGKQLGDSVVLGGKLEQSFGGLETIYDEMAGRAKAFAAEAASYGISANTYAEQAVSFGNALKQAFGGDSRKALKAANMAIEDMADNSAKLGTDITNIQNAYQGFAKGNFTMLDNLKLGYGGTKEEMERLLADAEKLTGIEYDISNFGDIVAAIHAIQDELGITGVAADEAKNTLSGSAAAMKASWQNFLAALTTGQDLQYAFFTLKENAKNFGENLLGMLKNLIKNLPDMIGQSLEGLSDKIIASFDDPEAYDQAADAIIAGLGTVLVKAGVLGWKLIKALVLGMAAGINTVFTIVDDIGKAAGEKVGEWYDAGSAYVQELMSGAAAKVDMWKAAAAGLIDQAKTAIVGKYEDLKSAGEELVANIKTGIENKVSEVLAAISTMISDIWNAIVNYDWAALGTAIVDGIKTGISNMASSVADAAANVKNNLVSGFKGLFGIASPSKLMADEIGKWIPAGIALGIEQNADSLDKSVADMGRELIQDMRRWTAPGNNRTGGSLDGAGEDGSRPIVVQTQVSLEGDARKIFRVVRVTNNGFERETGYNALAGGYA